ncbi:MAG: OmpA family protein [Prevotellaceae bacterium]|jgi:outer membrane protein OmpA-like peptidoglycan-associated protein|nr:OmpA family protein [Prevotellaceae bacterium]
MRQIILVVLMTVSTIAFAQEKNHKLTKVTTKNGNVWGAIPTVNGEFIFVEDSIDSKNDLYNSRLLVRNKNNEESQLSPFEQYQKIGSPYISNDGKEFYFVLSGIVHTTSAKSIFKSQTIYYPLQIMMLANINNEWSQQPAGFQYNSKDYSSADPCLSPDGKYLYFVSNKKGGYGGTDIYRCKRNGNGGWNEPENIGSNVNTASNERFPRFDTKGNLYFSSTANTEGDMDLFVCSPDENNYFKTPVKMDQPFNSKGDDFAISFIDENSGYISSNRDGGVDYIYRFESEIIKKAEPVKIIDTDKKTVTDTPKPTDTVKKVEKIEKVETVVQEDLLKQGQLQSIHFDFDKWRITDKHIKPLQTLIQFMKQHPTLVMEIGGHTDCIGTTAYNLKLSNQRAVSVKDYLMANGIEADRIVVKAFGSAHPVTDCKKSKDAIANDQNRRVEYRIIKY